MTRNHKLVLVSEVPRQVNTRVESANLVLCECSQNSGVAAYCIDLLKMTRNHKLVLVSEIPRQVNTRVESANLVLCECSQNSGVAAYCIDHKDIICHCCQTPRLRMCKTEALNEMKLIEHLRRMSLILLFRI